MLLRPQRLGHVLDGMLRVLVGIRLHEPPGLAEAIKASIGDLVSVLFLPIFFVFSGLRTDIGSLGSDGTLWVALGVVILVSCASKFGATFLAARATGLPWKESACIGLLMNTRALMALVVTGVRHFRH